MPYTPPLGNNADLVFSGGYTPPVGSSAVMDFFESTTVLHQIWTDENYVYAATSAGLDIYEIPNDVDIFAFVTYSGGFNTVWGNSDKIFIGTSDAGIKYLNKSAIASGTELVGYLSNFNYTLTSNYIKYIHGYENNILCVTDLGVDFTKQHPNSFRSSITISGGQKCFLTSNKIYYTISGSEWSLNRVNSVLWDWTTPDVYYATGGGIFESGVKINDIFITERTAADSTSNTIFAATSSGIYVIDEYDNNSVVYSNNDFTSIWADSMASLSSGKMYIAKQGEFSIIDLSSYSVVDYYTTTHNGAANEALKATDIVDLNVGT